MKNESDLLAWVSSNGVTSKPNWSKAQPRTSDLEMESEIEKLRDAIVDGRLDEVKTIICQHAPKLTSRKVEEGNGDDDIALALQRSIEEYDNQRLSMELRKSILEFEDHQLALALQTSVDEMEVGSKMTKQETDIIHVLNLTEEEQLELVLNRSKDDNGENGDEVGRRVRYNEEDVWK